MQLVTAAVLYAIGIAFFVACGLNLAAHDYVGAAGTAIGTIAFYAWATFRAIAWAETPVDSSD